MSLSVLFYRVSANLDDERLTLSDAENTNQNSQDFVPAATSTDCADVWLGPEPVLNREDENIDLIDGAIPVGLVRLAFQPSRLFVLL